MFLCFSSVLLLIFCQKYEEFATDFSFCGSERLTYFNSSSVFGLHIDSSLPTTRDLLTSLHHNQTPLLLNNTFQWKNKNWIGDVLNTYKDLQIEYDVRKSESSILNTYEAKLEDFLSTIEDNSDHFDSMYLMNEDILNMTPLPEDHFLLNQTIFGKDFFNLFPNRIKPKAALIIGGRGSRSFLHADPYEWTGWNYLLKGRKLWTFLPSGVTDAVLGDVSRNPPDAWNSARYNLSAGWVSNVDLYRLKVRESISTDVLMDLGKRHTFLNCTPDNPHQLVKRSILNKKWLRGLRSRTIFKQNSTTHINNVQMIEKQLSSMRNGNVPTFLSGHKKLDFSVDADIAARAVQIVQEEGELILIPPGIWHQVYHLEPSIAVAGQYMNRDNEIGVYKHILRWCSHGKEESSEDGILSYLSSEWFLSLKPEDRIAAVIQRGLRLQHGRRKGELLFKELYMIKNRPH